MLLCVKPLLSNDREMGAYTRAVSGQRLDKHVPTATDTNATIPVEDLSFLCDPCRDVNKQGIRLELIHLSGQLSSVRESLKRGLERVKLKNLHC
jgi:hypothetical protein